MAQIVKNLPAICETWVRSLGWEDSLEEAMVTHSSILAWRIPWTEEPGELQSMGSQKVKHDGATNTRILQRRKKYNFGFHVERRVERRKHERRELSWSKEEPHCPDTAFAPGRFS